MRLRHRRNFWCFGMNELRPSHIALVVAIGEVLWDIFPDGPRFGGAPANFACSVAGLASKSVRANLVSAVGRDDLGRRALDALKEHDVDASFVALRDAPTGQVVVQLDDRGQASYEIAPKAAWDNLFWSGNHEQLASRADVVCFGTLGRRSAAAQSFVQRFVDSARQDCIRILDVNLRPPYWNDSLILDSLSAINVLKCNDTELPVIASLLQVSGSEVSVLRQLVDRYSLQLVALTRGANGSLLVDVSGAVSEVPGESVVVADTVGAGDAFTAAIATGLLHDLPMPEMHAWASRVAAYVCSQAGATPTIPSALRLPEMRSQ
jgi:fructokinase